MDRLQRIILNIEFEEDEGGFKRLTTKIIS